MNLNVDLNEIKEKIHSHSQNIYKHGENEQKNDMKERQKPKWGNKNWEERKKKKYHSEHTKFVESSEEMRTNELKRKYHTIIRTLFIILVCFLMFFFTIFFKSKKLLLRHKVFSRIQRIFTQNVCVYLGFWSSKIFDVNRFFVYFFPFLSLALSFDCFAYLFCPTLATWNILINKQFRRR